jgi:hypothetical protein
MENIFLFFLFSLVQVQIQSLNTGFGPKRNTKVTFNTAQPPPAHPPPTQTFLPEGIVLG